MAVRGLPLLVLLVFPGLLQAQPDPGPPATIPENVPGTFVAPQPQSSVTPFVVPPTAKSAVPLPAAPPAPAITMLLLVPADVPPGQPIPYEIRVTNNSSADAGKVKVRMPMPEGATLVSADPPCTPANELVWEIKTLGKGETRKIEVKLKAGPGSEITAKAYVSYEFGQTVKTRMSNPKLKVTTELPREATSADEMIPVRVKVVNEGRVPLEKVKLTETISEGFEFHRDTDGERANSPLTRTWDLGTIPAGMGKTIEFRVLPKGGKDLLVRSNVDGSGQQDSHEAKLKILDTKLKVELRGDPSATDDVASFKVVVRNEGSTPLNNVRVIGTVPQDCRVTTRTNGGQLYQGQVVWLIPKIPPGDSFLFKWEMRSSVAGRKTVRAEASSDRGLKDSMDVQTVFAGTAALNWETRFEQPTVSIDRTGMFTIKVTNSGSEAAKGAKLTITLPDGVSFVEASPKQSKNGNTLVFETRDISAGASETFSVTFRGEKTGQAFFTAKLEAPGSKPLSAEKYVQITSR
jgi:uncharacterized repeat protein (TIGR01451 family)